MAFQISKTTGGATPVVTTVPLQEVNGTYGTSNIESIRNSKDAQLVFMPIPNMDSDKSIGFDLYGVKREVTVQGMVTGTPAELELFFLAMEDMHNGEQWGTDNKSLQFSIDFFNTITYNVLIKSFSWGWEKGIPNRLTYTMVVAEIDPNQGSS